MEQNQQSPGTSLFQLNLDAGNSYTLRSAASWAKVLAVCGIIMGILFFVIGVMVQNAISNTNFNDREYGGGGFGGSNKMLANAGMITYIILGLILVISSIFALNFSNKTSRALKTNDQASLSGGFAGIRNYFAFWAILMIISLLLILISVAGMMSTR